jgi:hypothetical protein
MYRLWILVVRFAVFCFFPVLAKARKTFRRANTQSRRRCQFLFVTPPRPARCFLCGGQLVEWAHRVCAPPGCVKDRSRVLRDCHRSRHGQLNARNDAGAGAGLREVRIERRAAGEIVRLLCERRERSAGFGSLPRNRIAVLRLRWVYDTKMRRLSPFFCSARTAVLVFDVRQPTHTHAHTNTQHHHTTHTRTHTHARTPGTSSSRRLTR